MRGVVFAVVVLIASGSVLPSANAQWLPLSAKHRQVIYKVSPDGTQAVTDEILGTFVRASNGSSLLTRQKYADGKPVGEQQAVLKDAASGKIYVLDYGQRRAVLRQQLSLPLQPMRRNLDPNAPQLTVNGVSCIEVPVKGSMVVSGKSCVSTVYDLTVRSDAVLSSRTGDLRDSDEYYDIQIGPEPSAALFVVPAGFEISSGIR